MMFLVDASSNSGASSQGIVLRNKVPLKKRGEKGNTKFLQEKSSKATEELDFESLILKETFAFIFENILQKWCRLLSSEILTCPFMAYSSGLI